MEDETEIKAEGRYLLSPYDALRLIRFSPFHTEA
jgi:hypothetical protein